MDRRLGHDAVGPAANLDAAQALAATPIDVAIIDVSLGRQSGYPAAELLAVRGVPFAFATGYGLDGLDSTGRGRPTLTKPFEFDALRAAVERMLCGG